MKVYYWAGLWLLLVKCNALCQTLSPNLGRCETNTRHRAAIVGAGVGGTSSSYYLAKEFGHEIQIDIFERGDVGGRASAIEVDGRVVELGASIIHNKNKHFRELAKAVGLQLVEPGKGDTERLFSIFDGQKIVFRQSEWAFITLSRLMWRYGFSYFWFQKSPAKMLEKFLKIYELQKQQQGFRAVEDLLLEVGLYQLTQRDMRSAVKDILGGGAYADRFGAEFVAAINHVNYNQNNSLNALAGMVSMLPTVDSNLLAVKGGNYRLAEKLLEASNATLHLGAKVVLVEKAGSTYLLHTQEKVHGPYDVVILATPLEHSSLKLSVPHLPHIPPREYQKTVTTVLRAKLRLEYFGGSVRPAGDYILVAEGSSSPFSVISPLESYANGTRLFKVFSKEILDGDLLSSLFEDAAVVAIRPWFAYPRFNPPEVFAKFELSEGLYYSNAIETSASAMEMSLIAAKNSVILASEWLRGGQAE